MHRMDLQVWAGPGYPVPNFWREEGIHWHFTIKWIFLCKFSY